MKATYIDYSDTGSFSKTLLDYLADAESLRPFYGERPTLEGFKAQIAHKKNFSQRQLLQEQLQDQYAGLLDDAPVVAQHITLLKDKNTFTVTTGHQLNMPPVRCHFLFSADSQW